MGNRHRYGGSGKKSLAPPSALALCGLVWRILGLAQTLPRLGVHSGVATYVILSSIPHSKGFQNTLNSYYILPFVIGNLYNIYIRAQALTIKIYSSTNTYI